MLPSNLTASCAQSGGPQGRVRRAVERFVYYCNAPVRGESVSKILEKRNLPIQRSVPVWTELAAEVARLEAFGEPKSPLGKANTYFRRQSGALSAFLDNGILPISNAHVERLLRGVALFRKNSLFVGSLEAGERYAALLTLAVNCALVGVNPFSYFTDVLERIAAGWPKSRAAELMPRAWLAAQQKAEQVDGDGGLGADHD